MIEEGKLIERLEQSVRKFEQAIKDIKQPISKNECENK